MILNALMTSTLFFRTTRHPNSLTEANFYLGVRVPLFHSTSTIAHVPKPLLNVSRMPNTNSAGGL